MSPPAFDCGMIILTLTKEKTMKIIIVGASGNIGQEIVKALESSHEIITAGLRRGDILVDHTGSDICLGNPG